VSVDESEIKFSEVILLGNHIRCLLLVLLNYILGGDNYVKFDLIKFCGKPQ